MLEICILLLIKLGFVQIVVSDVYLWRYYINDSQLNYENSVRLKCLKGVKSSLSYKFLKLKMFKTVLFATAIVAANAW